MGVGRVRVKGHFQTRHGKPVRIKGHFRGGTGVPRTIRVASKALRKVGRAKVSSRKSKRGNLKKATQRRMVGGKVYTVTRKGKRDVSPKTGKAYRSTRGSQYQRAAGMAQRAVRKQAMLKRTGTYKFANPRHRGGVHGR